MSSAKLYNAELLGLATSLAAYPLTADFEARGIARSPTCGSVVEVGVVLGNDGTIVRLGVKAQACAVGQAAAAIFAGSAPGKGAGDIKAALADIEAWLGGGEMPAWPEFTAIAAARNYPARHGAILLAWRAALAALEARG